MACQYTLVIFRCRKAESSYVNHFSKSVVEKWNERGRGRAQEMAATVVVDGAGMNLRHM